MRGQVDKYAWVDVGSSYLAGELAAAFLWAQLEEADRITAERLSIWDRYHRLIAPLEAAGLAAPPASSPPTATTTRTCTMCCSTRTSTATACSRR